MPTLSLSEMNAADALSFLRDKVGAIIRLTQQSNNQPAGSTWRINTVNKLGASVVVSAGPVDGKGRGFFFPYNTFEIAADDAADVEDVAEPLPFKSRDEFALIGADINSPLYKMFRTCAPQTPEAHDLYRAYANEYSEYDTELLDDTLRLFDIMPDQHWTNQIIQHVTSLLQNGAVVETTPEPEPFVPPAPPVIVEEETVSEVVEVSVEQEVAPAPRRRGRPPGSKNKPKTLEEQVQQDEARHVETARRTQPEPQWEDDVVANPQPGTISNGFATMTIEQFQYKFQPIEVPDVNLQADENFEQVYTDLKDKHFQRELAIFVGQMLEYLGNTATDPQALLAEATKVVSVLI